MLFMKRKFVYTNFNDIYETVFHNKTDFYTLLTTK